MADTMSEDSGNVKVRCPEMTNGLRLSAPHDKARPLAHGVG